LTNISNYIAVLITIVYCVLSLTLTSRQRMNIKAGARRRRKNDHVSYILVKYVNTVHSFEFAECLFRVFSK